jgi:branched-chain amino acid transport system ATP-binding protein
VTLLTAENIEVAYGDFQVLWNVSAHVDEGEIVALLGPNGAGKSTLMNTVSGLLRPRRGRVVFGDRRIDTLPTHRIVGEGIAHVLERRRLFPFLTVRDNLLLGAHHPAARRHRPATLEHVERLFPILHERRDQLAQTLSGGEQQMVAIARGLMARPRLLMIDEPFLGLAPRVVQEIGAVIRRIHDEGVAVLFVEQNVELALGLAHRGYILESGRLILDGLSADLLQSAEVKRVFLGDQSV